MRKSMALVLLCLLLCLLLCGCSEWLDGSYSSVQPHTGREPESVDQSQSVGTYQELCDALVGLVESGSESGIINVAKMNQDYVIRNMDRAVAHATRVNPIGAYAVESITYERGTSGGQSALSVTITYNHNRNQISKIRQAAGMIQVRQIMAAGLQDCESRLVIRVEQYRDTDLIQYVEDYADLNPDAIMEVPRVTINLYPQSGSDRVLELVFTYRNSRENLRSMQSRVGPLFTSAELYVSGSHSDHEKFSQLYAFLMERNQYTLVTSITPAYSLLVHGAGDSKAFAVVYSAMCRKAGLECQVISGTRDGEPWFWNLICDGDIYYHVDLLRCSQEGMFLKLTDKDMAGYVWDYSAYPASVSPEPEPTEPEPTEPDVTEPVDPEATEPEGTGEEAPETEPSEPTEPVEAE